MAKICAVVGCGRPVRARGWCVGHYNRWQRSGDPGTEILGLPASKRSGADHPRWSKSATYRAVHGRINAKRGSAGAHPCVTCGEPAGHWAYDHSDPNAKFDERGRPYSDDPDRYMALCISCHKRFDLDRRQVA